MGPRNSLCATINALFSFVQCPCSETTDWFHYNDRETALCCKRGNERHGDQCDLQRDSFLIRFTSKEDFEGRGVEFRSKCLTSEEPDFIEVNLIVGWPSDNTVFHLSELGMITGGFRTDFQFPPQPRTSRTQRCQ